MAVVKRRNDHAAPLFMDAGSNRRTIFGVSVVLDDRRAPVLRRRTFQKGRIGGHDHRGIAAMQRGSTADRLSVISR